MQFLGIPSWTWPCWNRKKVVLIGAGGHAKVVLEFLKKSREVKVVGLIEKDGYFGASNISGIPIIGTDRDLAALFQRGIRYALITVGSVGDNTLRENLFNQAKDLGFSFINIFHPSAIISRQASFGQGNTVMAGALIGPGSVLKNNIIINTGALVEHDCRVEDHVHIAPGAKIAGNVFIGKRSHIGIGSVIIQGKHIGENVLIGAGAVIVDDIPDNVVVMGVPGRIKYERKV